MKAAEEVEAKVGRLLRGEWGGELMTGRIDLTSPGSNTMQKGRGGGEQVLLFNVVSKFWYRNAIF